MLNGLDAVGLTLEKTSRIASFEREAAAERPWV
jgi:3-isopropylmalate/(R)-2-methylmalate dehydratase small subunit